MSDNGLTWPANVQKRILAEVDSTNAEAARIAADLTGPTWIMGLRQTAARGRRGRVWQNPEGNFAATYVMRPSEAADTAALRSFVASLALFDTLATITGRPEALSLKWPNDVLLNGGKIAGILLESSGQGGEISHMAIGIGVNLLHAPKPESLEAGAFAPVSLAGETGIVVTPDAFLDILAPAYAAREESFVTFGFEPIRTDWLARAARLGQPIVARTVREEIHGTFETVDPTGALVLKTAQGHRAIPAADVFF